MSIQSKPDYKVFASDAKSGEIETFPDILRGWGVTIDRTGEIPPMEWFNAIGKRADEWLLYLTQRGIPEWDSSLDYPKSAMVMYSDTFYIAKKASKGESPSVSSASWTKLSEFIGVPQIVQSTGSSASSVMSQDAATKSFMKVGDFGVGGIAASISDSELKQGGVGRFFRQGGGTDDGTFGTWGAGYQASYNSSVSAGIFIAPSSGISFSYVVNSGVVTRSALYSEKNTTTDTSGFLRSTGNKNALTTDKVTQSTGTSKELVMSQNAVCESLSFLSETWKNMKSERLADTNYTNATSKPIMVSVQGNEAQVGASVNGITIITGKTGQDHCSFIVQPGATYSVACRTILVWAELR